MNFTHTKHVFRKCKKRACFLFKLHELECQLNRLIRLRLIYWTMRNRFDWLIADINGDYALFSKDSIEWLPSILDDALSYMSETCLRLGNVLMLLIIAVSMTIAHIIYWPSFTSVPVRECVRIRILYLQMWERLHFCHLDVAVTSVCGMRSLFAAIKIAFDDNSGVECLRRIAEFVNMKILCAYKT